MRLTIKEVAYHRNGVGGDPFHVVAFKDRDDGEDKLAIVFGYTARTERELEPDVEYPDGSNLQVAVISLDRLPVISMLGGNAWRGDHYAPDLYRAIDEKFDADFPTFRAGLDAEKKAAFEAAKAARGMAD